jgi:hypothetical protein
VETGKSMHASRGYCGIERQWFKPKSATEDEAAAVNNKVKMSLRSRDYAEALAIIAGGTCESLDDAERIAAEALQKHLPGIAQ